MKGDIEFENEFDEIKRIKINPNDDIDEIARKLMECKRLGIRATAIFNGVALDNHSFDNVRVLKQSYENDFQTKKSVSKKESTSSSVDSFSSDTLPSSENKQEEIKSVQYIEVTPADTLDTVAKNLETCATEGIDAVAVFNDIPINNIETKNKNEIKDFYQKQHENEKALKEADIILEKGWTFNSKFKVNAKEIRVGRYDRIQEVIEKLKFCKEHGIDAFINFNGVQLNNYDYINFKLDDPYRIMKWYNEQQKSLQEKDQVNNQNPNVDSNVSNAYDKNLVDQKLNDNVNVGIDGASQAAPMLAIGGAPYMIGNKVDNQALQSFGMPSMTKSDFELEHPKYNQNNVNSIAEVNDSYMPQGESGSSASTSGNSGISSGKTAPKSVGAPGANQSVSAVVPPLVANIPTPPVVTATTIAAPNLVVGVKPSKIGMDSGGGLLYNPDELRAKRISDNIAMHSGNPFDEDDNEISDDSADDSTENDDNESDNDSSNQNDNNQQPVKPSNDGDNQQTPTKAAAEQKLMRRFLAFLKANPWVIGIFLVIILLLFIIISFVTINNKKGHYDTACDYTLTKVNLTTCGTEESTTLSLEDYVLGTTYELTKDKEYSKTALKAIMLVIKTNALAVGNYDSTTKQVSLDSCEYGYTKNTSLKTAYADIKDYLYLSASYNGAITKLSSANKLDLDEEIMDQMNTLSSDNGYVGILNKIYNPEEETDEEDNENVNIPQIYDDFIYVGDSRINQMRIHGIIDDAKTVYGGGYAYDWFVGNGTFSYNYTNYISGGIAGVNTVISNNPGNKNIIIWLGVNDLISRKAQTYYDKYYELATGDWSNHNLFIVNVGPVDENKSLLTTQMVDKFNEELEAAVNNSPAQNLNFVKVDYDIQEYDAEGLHYGKEDYENIYNAIMSNLNINASGYRLYNLADHCEFIEDEDDGAGNGLSGYPYLDIDYCSEITVAGYGTYSLEEYVAGVVTGEALVFHDETTFEIFAILARTFALNRLQNSNSCTIQSSESVQVFREPDAEAREAANNTRGLVLTRDEELFATMYDAFCWDKKDANYYYLCQGNYDTGEPLKVPVSWAQEYVSKFSGTPFLNNARYRSHGQGVSADGAYYMVTELNKSATEVISYFYGKDTKIMSIYPTTGSDGPGLVNCGKYNNGQIFSQIDPRWGYKPLGKSKQTMASAGCAVTSIAIGIACSGTETSTSNFSAGTFIDTLNANSCFSGAAIYWGCSGIQEAAPNVRLVHNYNFSKSLSKEAKIAMIEDCVNQAGNYFVVLHFSNAAHSTHYEVYNGVDGDSFLTLDSYSGALSTILISDVDQIVIYSY